MTNIKSRTRTTCGDCGWSTPWLRKRWYISYGAMNAIQGFLMWLHHLEEGHG